MPPCQQTCKRERARREDQSTHCCGSSSASLNRGSCRHSGGFSPIHLGAAPPVFPRRSLPLLLPAACHCRCLATLYRLPHGGSTAALIQRRRNAAEHELTRTGGVVEATSRSESREYLRGRVGSGWVRGGWVRRIIYSKGREGQRSSSSRRSRRGGEEEEEEEEPGLAVRT